MCTIQELKIFITKKREEMGITVFPQSNTQKKILEKKIDEIYTKRRKRAKK